jgi:putative ABC transport system substrate-binding protein
VIFNLKSEIENLKSNDSAERAGASGSGHQIAASMEQGAGSRKIKATLMRQKIFSLALSLRLLALSSACVLLLALCSFADAQQSKLDRIGVIHQGGPYKVVVDGLQHGLRELGYEDGKHIRLEIQDTKSDVKLVEHAAQLFERERVKLIYAVTTSVATVVKNITSYSPIVFTVGSDPVASGLVQSFAKPGGRLTGVQYSTTDLTGKRLEILKEIIPKLTRVLTVFNAENPMAKEAAALAREAAQHLGVQVVERQVGSVEELRQRLGSLKTGEVNAFFYTTDAMVTSQAQLVIDLTTSKRLPTMFSEQSLAVMGGLASYGQNFHEIGRHSAKFVQKIMAGQHPQDLRVETVDKFELVINLKTAKQIGLTIPPHVLARADKVIR